MRILNSRFDEVTTAEVADQVIDMIRAGERGWLCTVNVAILMMMQDDAQLQRFVDQARFVVADGQPLIWASKLAPRALPERVTGVDLVEELCARAAREELGVYLLGAQRDIVDQVERKLCQRYPGLHIAGVDDGYFTWDEAQARAEHVRQSGAHILIVAMGVPRQERFIEEYWEQLGVPFAIGVGGSFDVVAGLRQRAPRVVQAVGMEWAFRLAQEPRRLFKRYLMTNSRFIWQMSKDIATGRKGLSEDS